MICVRSINKVIYLLLTFFLGGFGIHKFYAGKNLAGVLYLVLCWTGISEFLAIFDFIFGLFKRSDRNGNILV